MDVCDKAKTKTTIKDMASGKYYYIPQFSKSGRSFKVWGVWRSPTSKAVLVGYAHFPFGTYREDVPVNRDKKELIAALKAKGFKYVR